MPKGTTDVPGVLLGWPALDAAPHGLGWQALEKSHWFSGINLHMPRAEDTKRYRYAQELTQWLQTGKPNQNISMRPEQCNSLRDHAKTLREEVTAYFDGEPFTLQPNEQAIVPAQWSGGWVGGSPPSEFYAVHPPQGDYG